MDSLAEIDHVEILVIVDNEVDPLSSYQHPDLTVSGRQLDVASRAPLPDQSNRGGAQFEFRLDNLCCGGPRVVADDCEATASICASQI